MEKSENFITNIRKFEITKLPSPYDTHCHDYGTSNRYECVNQCMKSGYMTKFNCLPNNNQYYTVVINDSLNQYSICARTLDSEIANISTMMFRVCQISCKESCSDHHYQISSTENGRFENDDLLKMSFYSTVSHLVNITQGNGNDQNFQGGGIFEKFSARGGGKPKISPTPYSRCLHNTYFKIVNAYIN